MHMRIREPFNSLMHNRIRELVNSGSGIWEGKSRIRDKDPRSATPTAAVNTIYTGLRYFPGLITAVDHKREILKLCENAAIGDDLFSN